MTKKSGFIGRIWRGLCGFVVWTGLWEPNAKGKKYKAAKAWADRYIEERLPELKNDPDRDLRIYQRALKEHDEIESSHKQLVAKAQEILKLSSAFIGGYALLNNWAQNAGRVADAAANPKLLETWSGKLAVGGLIAFVFAVLLAVSCLKGMPYLTPIRTKTLLDDAADRAKNETALLRSAIQMYVNAQGSRAVNNWISTRVTAAWCWLAGGLILLIASVLISRS